MAASPLISSPLPKLSNIRFATDFSISSEAALPYACAIAKHAGATLHIVHVVGHGGTPRLPRGGAFETKDSTVRFVRCTMPGDDGLDLGSRSPIV